MQALLNDLRRQQVELECRSEVLRQTQLELEESRPQYVALNRSAPVGYCTLSESGVILDANRTLGVLLGVPSDSLMHRSIQDYVCVAHHDLYADKQRHLLHSGEAQTFELKMVKHDGLNFWVSVSAAVRSESGREPVLRVVIKDISARKETETALLERDRHLQLIACNMPGPVSRVDRNLRYQFVNPYYERITGKPLESLIGLTMREVFGDDFFPLSNIILAGASCLDTGVLLKTSANLGRHNSD